MGYWSTNAKLLLEQVSLEVGSKFVSFFRIGSRTNATVSIDTKYKPVYRWIICSAFLRNGLLRLNRLAIVWFGFISVNYMITRLWNSAGNEMTVEKSKIEAKIPCSL